jgi:cell division inhibitor SepF
VSIVSKFKDFIGLNEEYEYDDDLGDYHPEYEQSTDTVTQGSEEDRRYQRRTSSMGEVARNPKLNNVVGMPGIANGVAEMVLIEPRSFEEMPQVIDALRGRKSVILNMTFIRQEEAQRAVDFVAGGTYAIDGHYERIGDNIFLFTPSCVQVSTPTNVIHEVTQHISNLPRTNHRHAAPATSWGNEPIQVSQ